jgi:excisionase family DNA binding protein
MERSLGAGKPVKKVRRQRRTRVFFEEANERLKAFVNKEAKIRDNDIIMIRELANLFNRSVQTIREWAKSGKIPFHKTTAGRYYFLRSDFAEFDGIKFDAYTPRQVAEKLNKTIDTVLRWINEGLLPANKIGGRWQVTEEDLQMFLDGGM